MKRLLYLLLLAPFVLLAGCIKEDYTDCERCTLTFSYTGDVTQDIFPDHITRVSLYVFDQDQRLVLTKQIEQNELKAFQGTKLNLQPGKYTVVGIGNSFDKTEVSSTSSQDFTQMEFYHPNVKTGGAVEGNDPLYLGRKEIVIPAEYWYKDDVAFRSSHLKVSYTVEDYLEDGGVGNGLLDLRVKNLLPETDFNNRAHGEKMTYTPLLSVTESGDHEGKFNIMRHTKDADVEFELVAKSTGEVLHTLSLADFLAQYPQIDVSKQEVLIPIIVQFKNFGVEVTIPDWLIVDVAPDYKE